MNIKTMDQRVTWQNIVLEWLRHENVTRPNVREALKDNTEAQQLLRAPNLKSRSEGVERVEILASFRPYLSLHYFTKRNWFDRTLDEKALDKLSLPVDTGWKHVTNGTYRPSDAAKVVLEKPESLSKFSDSFNYISENFKMLSEMTDKLIVVCSNSRRLEIIEGAHRLTAVFYRKLKEPDFVVKPMEVYVGKNKIFN
jgi:hypothetical protein